MAAPAQTVFHAAVERTLGSWTALQLAVQHGFGGAESVDKALWLIDAVDQWFQDNSDIEAYELEDFLADILNNEFDTVADDGSLSQVAASICGYFRMCAAGREDEVTAKIQKLPAADLRQCQAVQVNDEVDDDDEDEDGKPPQLIPSEQMDCSDSHPSHQAVPNTETNQPPTQSAATEQMESEEMAEDDGWTVVNKKSKKR